MPKKSSRRKAKIGVPRRPTSFLERLKRITVGDAASAAMQAYGAASSALLAYNSEVKVIDVALAKAAINWTGVVTPISLLAQGSNLSDRDGDSLRIRGLELRWVIQSAAATMNMGRTIIFADRQQAGVLPTSAQILQHTGTALTPLSPWEFANERLRFNVLYDSGPVGVDPAGRLQVADQVVIPYNEHSLYFGAAGTIAEAREGNLFVLQIADIAAAGPLMGFESRVHFVDN